METSVWPTHYHLQMVLVDIGENNIWNHILIIEYIINLHIKRNNQQGYTFWFNMETITSLW